MGASDLKLTAANRRKLEREKSKRSRHLVPVPESQWPASPYGKAPQLVFLSDEYLVQVYRDPNPDVYVRLTVCRTTARGSRWRDGIPWDDLQRLKGECGYGSLDAVEVFPSDADLVNVANMRHLWVMRQPVSFAWRSRKEKSA